MAEREWLLELLLPDDTIQWTRAKGKNHIAADEDAKAKGKTHVAVLRAISRGKVKPE